MLQGERRPAGAGVHAHPGLVHPHPVRERGVEDLDEHVADVVAHPLLEHLDEELAVLLGADAAVGDELALLPVERSVTGSSPPAGLGEGEQLRGDPLDDGDELDELRTELVAQERVDLAAVVAVGRVDGGEHVPVDPVPPEYVEPAHHPVEGGLAALVDPVGVVHLARAVDGQAHQEVVLVQERAPLVVEQRAVGLHRVEHRLPGPAELLLQLEGPPQELEAHQGRLAALEGDHDLVGALVGREQLADVGLVHARLHPEPAAGVELLLGQEEAVLAVEVADGARGLGHHVEGGRSGAHPAMVRPRLPARHHPRRMRPMPGYVGCMWGRSVW